MKRKILSIALVLLLIVSLLPVNASAATNATEIRKQITSMYQKIAARAGVPSLNGMCGLMTSWQIYLTGIDMLIPHDGKDQYDAYASQEITSGGYQVRPYPASEFTLREALNIISENGTRNVYNLLVGFQRTNTEAGSIYGHSLFIHAIIDGMVYFMEGFDLSVGERYFTAGQAIECSIADFCDCYSGWVTFEGIIYFGLDSYAKACQAYSANLYVQTSEMTLITADVPSEDPAYPAPKLIRAAAPGEWLHVTGVYETPEGIFYYQISEDGTVGYVPEDTVILQKICYDDITASDILAPGLLAKKQSFYLSGKLRSELNLISTVLVEVYAEGADFPVLSLETEQNTYSYSLNTSEVNRAITFGSLEEGSYEYRLSVGVANHYVLNGHLQTKYCTVPVWSSQFQVGGDTKDHRTVTFDACGGTVTENKMVVYPEEFHLPTAERAGYAFLGWYTDPEGGTAFTAETTAATAYAHWGPRTDGYSGWDLVDGVWQYYEDGVLQTGWLNFEGIQYYLNQGGSVAVGWSMVYGAAALILLEHPDSI